MGVPSAAASMALASSWAARSYRRSATSQTAAGWIAGTAWWDGRRRGLEFGEPLEVDVKQTISGQLVEVELGGVTSNAVSVGGLAAADRRRLSGHVGVKITPTWVGECRDASHPLREIIVSHERHRF